MRSAVAAARDVITIYTAAACAILGREGSFDLELRQRPRSQRQDDRFARRSGNHRSRTVTCVRGTACLCTAGVRACSRSTTQRTATTAAGLEPGSDAVDGTIGFDGTRSRGVGHRDDSFSSRAGGPRAIAMATREAPASPVRRAVSGNSVKLVESRSRMTTSSKERACHAGRARG